MRFFSHIAIAIVGSLVGRALAHPVALPIPVQTVTPGGPGALIQTFNNTINATAPAPAAGQAPTAGQLQMSLVNNYGGAAVNAYVTGLDADNQLVILQPNGQWYYPAANGASTPQAITTPCGIPLNGQGQTTQVTLPSYISAGRVWFAAGELQFFVVQGATGPSLVEPSAVNPSDPSADVNWGFVELTYTEDGGLYANISYVDFVGLILGMTLTGSAGTQTAQGLSSNAVTQICNDLIAQGNADGMPWGDLCVHDTNGNPLRVIAPGDYISTNPDAFSDYWTNYVNQVWSTFTPSNPLTIDTQAAAGNVKCSVSGGEMTCDGDNRGYAQPVAGDIFGCNSGPFSILEGDSAVHYAVVPRLCAAFDRSSFFVAGGSTQPGPDPSLFYPGSPTNWYSAFVHKYEIDGKGYAFAYDDVTADSSTNESGELTDPAPNVLTVTIGGPSS